jgi:isopentenyl diphosphate isomerase/L-lactate dehydrogenase-like FMN-dependent dehydrogenase
MSTPSDSASSRRQFLRYLAGSPLFALGGANISQLARMLDGSAAERRRAIDIIQQQAQEPTLIGAASEALNVFDFEPVARKKLPPAHWGYLATGTDDDETIRANREGFTRWDLHPRRLVDVTHIDTSVKMLGTTWATPIVVNPVGSQRAFHPEGELAVARAAKARGHLQVLSTVATTSIEDVIAARGAPVWFQLYAQNDWNATKQMVKRAEAAGAPAVVFTVDLIGGSNRETMLRWQTVDTRNCENCHIGGRPRPGVEGSAVRQDTRRKPAIAGIVPGERAPEVGTPTWEFVKRLRDATSMKVFIKGIVTREDAELAIDNGVSGVFVSNHGGRAENSGRATITSLPEVVAGIRGRGVVIVDGGFRRGTDIFKAHALGATAIGIGRPYIWGLASFGQEGVETVLALLRRELEVVMKQAGTTSIAKITKSYIVAHNA